MGRTSRSERNVVNLVTLRHVRDALEDNELRSDVDHVLDDLRQDAAETLPKAAAARVLGVSRGTLEKWISRAMIPTRTVDGLERVERTGLEEIAAEVAALRRLRDDHPAVLAEALTRLADRDPEFAGMGAQVAKSLKDIERHQLVPLRIPDGFGPED
jgi:transposase-like protein